MDDVERTGRCRERVREQTSRGRGRARDQSASRFGESKPPCSLPHGAAKLVKPTEDGPAGGSSVEEALEHSAQGHLHSASLYNKSKARREGRDHGLSRDYQDGRKQSAPAEAGGNMRFKRLAKGGVCPSRYKAASQPSEGSLLHRAIREDYGKRSGLVDMAGAAAQALTVRRQAQSSRGGVGFPESLASTGVETIALRSHAPDRSPSPSIRQDMIAVLAVAPSNRKQEMRAENLQLYYPYHLQPAAPPPPCVRLQKLLRLLLALGLQHKWSTL